MRELILALGREEKLTNTEQLGEGKDRNAKGKKLTLGRKKKSTKI